MSGTSAEFFDVWDTYHKVVASDYMFHREIGAKVQQALEAHFGDRPFSFLDLGCGDATALAPILTHTPPSRYKGVDTSETALALAAKTLSVLPCSVELAHQDIITTLASEDSYDVIYSSFVLHHLPTHEKATFFRLASERLAPRGLLLLVDTVREEDESLDVYLHRYCGWIEADWPGLAAAEKHAICDHLVNYDMPEPFSVLEAQARAAGLALTSNSKHNWHRLMCVARA